MENNPENTGQIQAERNSDGTFAANTSGNPSGKPRGSKNKNTLVTEALLDGEADAITRKVIDLALDGDITAIKICLDRITPTLKPVSQAIRLDIPQPDNLTDTARAIIAAAGNGDIPPDIAAQLVSAVANVARVEEMEQLKERLEAMERAFKEAGQ